MAGRTNLLLIFVVSLLVCAYDVYGAVRSQGHNWLAWILAAIMAALALLSLRKLILKDYSGTWW